MADPNPSWRLHKTPNPAERSLSVTVLNTDNAQKTREFDAFKHGMLFKDFPSPPDPTLQQESQFGLYKFVEVEENSPISLDYIFVRQKTLEEIVKPFKSDKIKQPFGWLPVLTFLEFAQNRGAPLSQNTADAAGRAGTVIIPRWLVRRGYVHGQTVMTTIERNFYLSDEPWPDSLLPCDEPMGTEVSWDLPSSHGSTGRCLHKDELVPGDRGPYAVISSDGQAQSATATGQTADQRFYRTNAIKWQDFITNEVQEVMGQFLRIESLYRAPIMPKASILA